MTQRKQALGAGTPRMGIAHANYQKYSIRADHLSGELLQMIVAELGEQPELAQACIDVSTAASRYDFAHVEPGSHAMNFGERPPAGPPGGQRPPGGFTPPAIDAAKGLTVIVSGGPFTSSDGLQGEAFFAHHKRRFEALKEVGQTLDDLAGGVSRNGSIKNGNAHILLTYTGDVRAIADRIEFGKVTNVDAAARTITVQMADVATE